MLASARAKSVLMHPPSRHSTVRGPTYVFATSHVHQTTICIAHKHKNSRNSPFIFNLAPIKARALVITRRNRTFETMIAARTALKNTVQRPFQKIALRGMAAVQVEHGRGEWKTYGDLATYKEGKFQIKCFNKISPVGLSRFPADEYDVRTQDTEAANAHAILLRSHKLKEEEVPKTTRAIARYAPQFSFYHRHGFTRIIFLKYVEFAAG